MDARAADAPTEIVATITLVLAGVFAPEVSEVAGPTGARAVALAASTALLLATLSDGVSLPMHVALAAFAICMALGQQRSIDVT